MTASKTKRPVRMLFAAVDIGYRIELYTKFIRQHFSSQLKTESLNINQLPVAHYITDYDYRFDFAGKSALYRWPVSLLNFLRCLPRYDMFHFFSGETLLSRKLRRFELMMYKLFGKKVIMHFVGSDVRSVPYSVWRAKNMQEYLSGKDDFRKSVPWQKKLINDAETFSDYILVSTPDLLKLIPSAHYYPVVLDLNKFIKELKEAGNGEKHENEVVILHCPSDREAFLKGTIYINEVLNRIKSTGAFNIKVLLPALYKNKTEYANKGYAVSRYELFKLFNQADIVIDQMITGWYGLQSIEALAAGKEVICYIDEKLKQYLYPGCPIHMADINSLENVLTSCIEKVMKEKGTDAEKKVAWVKKYHTIEMNHRTLLDAWNIKE